MICKHCGEEIEECVDCHYLNICKGYVHPGYIGTGGIKQHSCVEQCTSVAYPSEELPAHRAAIREDSDTVIIEMTKAHAHALVALLSYVGGDPDTSRRGLMNELRNDLVKEGFTDAGLYGKYDIAGSLEFKGEKLNLCSILIEHKKK